MIQRLLSFDRYSYQLSGLEAYCHWIVEKVEYVTQGHPLMGIFILLMPIVIIVSLFFTMVYHAFGMLAYYMLNFILVWLCMDGRDLAKKPYLNVRVADFFTLTYERLFAVIFWFILLGPAGLILYTATISLRNFLSAEGHDRLLSYALKLKALLDWAPVRLLGLSYGLVGHFTAVSSLWPTHLKGGSDSDARLVVEYGCAALGLSESALDQAQADVIHLINRALLLWLTVIAVVTLIFYL